MNYYFDVKLNFLSRLYNYYEWDVNDNVMNAKKVPIIKVSFSDFIKIINSKIKVNKEFLEKIKNKTIIDGGCLEYACIITDSNNSLGILFDENGYSILYSGIRFNDELNIEEAGIKLKKESIDFIVIENYGDLKTIRFDDKIKRMINNEIKLSIENENFSKLKYIYNEVNKTNEKDIDVIIKNLRNLKDNELINIYEVINFDTKNA